jgi:hypothetical protein
MTVRTEATEVREASATDDRQLFVDESPEGVDRTMIYHMLSLSPAQRLAMVQGVASSLCGLRDGRRARA